MRKSKFTEGTDHRVPQAGRGRHGRGRDLYRSGGFSDATFWPKWRAKFGGMEASDARRLRSWRAETC